MICDRQITFAAAERVWHGLLADDDKGLSPNYLHWGFFPSHFVASPECSIGGYGSIPAYPDPARELHTLYVGHSDSGACLNAPADYDNTVLALDSSSGELYFLSEARGAFDRPGDSPLAHLAPTQVETHTQEGKALSPPDIRVAAAATVSLLALLLALYFLPALKVIATQALYLPGYARVRKERVLDHETRDQILETVKQDPGLSMSDLGMRIGVGWGTLVHHVTILEKHKLLSSQVQGRHRRVFPVRSMDFSAQGRQALLRNERARMLFEIIHHDPGVIQDQLARRIGISPPAAYWHLKRLQQVGLVAKVRAGRHVRYYAETPTTSRATYDGVEVA